MIMTCMAVCPTLKECPTTLYPMILNSKMVKWAFWEPLQRWNGTFNYVAKWADIFNDRQLPFSKIENTYQNQKKSHESTLFASACNNFRVFRFSTVPKSFLGYIWIIFYGFLKMETSVGQHVRRSGHVIRIMKKKNL